MTPPLRHDHLDRPHDARLSPGHPHREEILARHSAAMRSSRPSYRDPATGLQVLTARFLADRGYCCESGCRHCPYVGADATRS